MGKNKVKYNLKNVHIAVKKASGTYDTPFELPGAVNMSLSPQKNFMSLMKILA